MIVFVLHWLAPAVFPPTSCLESGGSIQGDLWRCFCVEETLLHGPILPTRAPKLFTTWVFQSDGQSLWSFPSLLTHPVCNYTLHLPSFLTISLKCCMYVDVSSICMLPLCSVTCLFLEGETTSSQDPAGKLGSSCGSWAGTWDGVSARREAWLGALSQLEERPRHFKVQGGGFSQQLRNPWREPAPRKPFPKQDSKLLLTISFQSLTRARSLHPAAGVRTRVTACDTHTSSPNLRDGPKEGPRGGPGCPRLQPACQGSRWGSWQSTAVCLLLHLPQGGWNMQKKMWPQRWCCPHLAEILKLGGGGGNRQTGI